MALRAAVCSPCPTMPGQAPPGRTEQDQAMARRTGAYTVAGCPGHQPITQDQIIRGATKHIAELEAQAALSAMGPR